MYNGKKLYCIITGAICKYFAVHLQEYTKTYGTNKQYPEPAFSHVYKAQESIPRN